MAPSSSKATTRAPAKSTGAPANGTGTTKKGTGKTAPAKQNNTAAEATEATTTIADDRFRFIQRDPRFIRLRKRDAKVTLDQRFSHMIDNDDFDFVQKVDKYGRPMSVGAAPRTDLKKFYKLDEKEGEEKERSEADNVVNDSDTSEENVASGSEEDDASVSDASDNDVSVDSDAIASSSEQEEYDPARGEGVPDSSSDEDDVDAVNDDTIETIRLPGAPATVDEDLYREIREPQVPTGEESRRFAVVNMDWDNMSALDLFKVFDAFKPNDGVIRAVSIYPSDFGKERLAKVRRLCKVHGCD